MIVFKVLIVATALLLCPSLGAGYNCTRRYQRLLREVTVVNSFGNPGKTKVRCDMETDKGGWIVIQCQVPNGTVNFYRGWKDYEEGFGDLGSEFWYGLRNIHCLTTRESVELRIDLQDEQGNKFTWVYQQFSVDGPDQKYRLHIGQGTGTPPCRVT